MKDINKISDIWNIKRLSLNGYFGDHGNGYFKVNSPIDSYRMNVIISDGLGWDHVSVSRGDRCPTWEEMDFIKRLFFEPNEVVMQLHVGESDHVNIHNYCLHLWRPNDGVEIPLPQKEMV